MAVTAMAARAGGTRKRRTAVIMFRRPSGASSTVARTGVADESVPGPAWNPQAFWYVVGGAVIPGHRRCGRPREVVMQDLSEPIVPVEADVDQGLVEAGDRATVHLLVRPVATVEAND